MPDSRNNFYLTTPIYYVNARPHIGHAYTTIVADVLARRHRLLGEDTYFLTGTDEHGQKIERSAAAAGIPPQQFADQVSKSFRDLWQRMGITHDQFIRTTSPAHARGVQKLFSKLYENGHIELKAYTGSYCVSDEAFIDAPVGTPCPDCGRLLEEVTEENFFFKLSNFQEAVLTEIYQKRLVITPQSAENEVLSFLAGPAVAIAETFRPTTSSNSTNWTIGQGLEEGVAKGLLKTIIAEIDGVKNTLYYIPGHLKDLSISRSSFTWGIPVPEPAASTTKQPHVIYVWLDALANYMTGLGYGSDDETLFKKFWPADLHLVGKEITRFHCIYWPAFLLAAGIDLPKQITANGWLLFDNAKMSKSKGNIVRTETILDAFGTLCPPPLSADTDRKGPALAGPQDTQTLKGTGFSPSVSTPSSEGALAPEGAPAEPAPHDRDLFAADVLRYYLLREIPFGQDGSFSFDALITRYNADLANGYGNLVSRTFGLISKSCSSVIPDYYEWSSVRFASDGATSSWKLGVYPDAISKDLWDATPDIASVVSVLSQQYRFNVALEAVWSLISAVDGLLSVVAPWKQDRTGLDDVATPLQALYLAAESIRIITALLYPILPYATARVWAQLGLGDIELAAKNGELKDLQWGGLKPGTKLGPLGPIFPRAPKELAQTMTDMENANVPSSKPSALNPEPSSSPAAPPRTSDLPEPALTVAGSHAHTTGPADLPSHKDIPGSGIFAEPVPKPSTLNPEPSPQITIDDFARIDLRVAEIVLAERIPKADKLLRLEVDLGPLGRRQILSGIAEHYTPEELTGRRIVVIANLAPRKMRGLESHGMLLAASDGENGKPHLATCGEDVPLGSRLK